MPDLAHFSADPIVAMVIGMVSLAVIMWPHGSFLPRNH
jgi:hypothetical protein